MNALKEWSLCQVFPCYLYVPCEVGNIFSFLVSSNESLSIKSKQFSNWFHGSKSDTFFAVRQWESNSFNSNQRRFSSFCVVLIWFSAPMWMTNPIHSKTNQPQCEWLILSILKQAWQVSRYKLDTSQVTYSNPPITSHIYQSRQHSDRSRLCYYPYMKSES